MHDNDVILLIFKMKADGRFDIEKIAEDWSVEINHVYAALRFCGISSKCNRSVSKSIDNLYKNIFLYYYSRFVELDDECEKAFKLFTCVDDLFDYSMSVRI